MSIPYLRQLNSTVAIAVIPSPMVTTWVVWLGSVGLQLSESENLSMDQPVDNTLQIQMEIH